MDTHLNPSFDTASTDAVSPFGPRPAVEAAPARIGWFEGHMPDVVDPLDPLHPQTAFSETRHMRHDGWTPDKMRLFLARLAECGVVKEAFQAAAMSARAAYNLRDRDPLFAAGWEAAGVMARSRLADEAYSRSINGVMERIYKDGAIIAERHRYDNKLTMSVLGRLDARIDRAEERGDPHLRLVARWDDYLDALASGRREEGLALLSPPEPPLPPARPAPRPEADLRTAAGDRELHELRGTTETEMADEEEDWHSVWDDGDGSWTDYPPPPGFDGEEIGAWGDDMYKRRLSPAEQAVVDAERAAEEASDRAMAEAQRDAYFGLADRCSVEENGVQG